MTHIFSRLGYTFLAAGVFFASPGEACTGFKLIAKDGSSVHGRTLEFGLQLDTSIAVVPRNFDFEGTTPTGTGITYKSRYTAVGVIAFDKVAILDGINEAGLAIGTFYFPGFAGYSTLTPENKSKALSPVEFPNWVLTQFATVDEVLAGLENIVIVPTVSPDWGTTPPPFHYIVYDKNGKCLVIEPMTGHLTSFENRLGVYTNSPNFGWHMLNLRNFVALDPFNPDPLKILGTLVQPFGFGAGMLGIPGDFTPPSRFVRAAFFAANASPSENSEEAVFQAFHILNQFDIPKGISRQKEGENVAIDYTMLTCVRDPQTLKYYFRTYDDQTIRYVDMNRLDLNARTVKKVSTASTNRAIDFTGSLK